MARRNKFYSILYKSLTYILVAALASCATFWLCLGKQEKSKLEELKALILECFIGEADTTAMEDAAASAMVASLGDRWSYYIPADSLEAHMEQLENQYVGIGVTISSTESDKGFFVTQVEPDGGAKAAGIQVGDIITHIEGQSAVELGMDAAKEMIRGEEGTQIQITVLRDGAVLNLSVTRQKIKIKVAEGRMLDDGIGLITIANFDERCADETIAQVKTLLEQGARGFIFDVRFNPGGYKRELVDVLDYLLPEGTLFRSLSYDGTESVDKSDASCLELPMAVLVNGGSYSAAEFFAAALDEYDWAVLVGEPTVGKGYFQNTIELSDGSAVGLSMGKYFTPNGVSLAEEGGLVPEVLVKVDDETAAKIYAGQLDPTQDPQIQAAVAALKEELN